MGVRCQAKERYEADCLKLNSYTANSQLVQGKELDRLQTKLERVRQTIGANEQDFRQCVRVLEGTTGKWEQEGKAFCDVSCLDSPVARMLNFALACAGYGGG